MHGIEEGLLDKGCTEASDLLYFDLSNENLSANSLNRCSKLLAVAKSKSSVVTIHFF